MKLTTDYREEAAGGFSGSKNYYLVCQVEFTQEERALAEERGLYDFYISVPAATPFATRAHDFGSMAMRMAGVILIPLGVIIGCAMSIQRSSGGPGFILFIAGIALFVVGKLRDRQASKRDANPEQHITLRQLLGNPTFQVHAYAMDIAQSYEEEVRQQLSDLSQRLKAHAVVPEKTTYEL